MNEKIKSRVGETLLVRIDSLAFGGDGVGRVDGEVIFVPYAAPGDTLRVRVTEVRAHYLKAVVEEILKPAACRRAPRCRHFGRCGGCFWQHVDYPAQLEAKRAIVEESLKRIGGVDAKLLPIVPSPAEYGYRNRVRLHVSASNELGYFERGSSRLVAIEECPVLEPQLERRLPGLASTPAATVHPSTRPAPARSDEPPFRTIELASGENAARPLPPSADEEPEGLPPFRQVNSEVNRRMVLFIHTTITNWSREGAFRVLDLYCGDGNLSLPLGAQSAYVEGFDLSREAVARANAQAARLGIRARYRAADIRRAAPSGLAKLLAADRGDQTPLVVLADPPRAGLGEVASAIARTPARMLVYVSCNPPVLARDARNLVALGFKLDLVQPFDMFPQTYHVETVAVFRRDQQ